MEITTKYPVLIDPTTVEKNNYRLSASTKQLPGVVQEVSVEGLTIKGTTPVFFGDDEITKNEFMYQSPVVSNNKTLTPMDEYLYSERNISEGRLQFGEFENWGDVFQNLTGEERRAKRAERKTKRKDGKVETTAADIKAALEDIPGGPTKAEQEAKLKEGKFWNAIKGGWDNFTKSSSGQILIDSATSYLAGKLGGGSNYQPMVTDTTPPAATPDQPMSKTTKTILIVGGVALVGIIVYSMFKSSK